MDVSRLLDSMGEDSRRSSILFGIHSESKALQELERVQRQNRRFSLLAALAIFLLVAALICLIVYDLYRNRPEVIPPQTWQANENVEIVGDTRRWGKEEEEAHMNDEPIVEEKHANHRYEPLEERTGTKPQPFHLPEEQNSSANHVFVSPPGFTPPVRFRGIYIHPTQHPDERNQEYYQKINSLFTKPDRLPDSDPATSDLFTKAVYPSRQAIWNRKNTKPSRKPFTVMLDIYPMDGDDNRHLVEGQKPRDTIFIPMRQYSQQPRPVPIVQHVPQVMLPPRQQKKRMFMKLNLFPKVRDAQRRTWSMRQEDDGDDYEDDYDEDEEDEDEEEPEEPEEHSCNGIVGHNPYGKPITAKWKTKNGEWVHAKKVILNQWDEERD